MSEARGEGFDHYFTSPSGPVRTRILTVRLAGREIEVDVAPGVFSGTRLDPGTQVLLRKVPAVPDDARHLLDLGCGWGPIALTMALAAPGATVWAVDVNDVALQLTAANAARLGLRNVRAVRPQDVPGGVRFDAVWSNPPIRIGRSDLEALLLRWLSRLAPGASAHLVVQRHLGADSLQRWLEDLATGVPPALPGARVDRLGSAKGYRVLSVTAGRTD